MHSPRGGCAVAPHSKGRPVQRGMSHVGPVNPAWHQQVPLTHVPRPLASLQPRVHGSPVMDWSSQRSPCHPTSHLHCPWTHTPLPEHADPLALTAQVARSHLGPLKRGAHRHRPSWHTPWGPQPPEHTGWLQSMPAQPSWHLHVPFAEHAPWPEQSVRVHCPRPAHCRLAQVGPPHPTSHRQRPAWHMPWPEQLESQSCSRRSHAGPVRPGGQRQ